MARTSRKMFWSIFTKQLKATTWSGQCKLFKFSKMAFIVLTIAFSDDDVGDSQKQNRNESSLPGPPVGPNPFLDIPQNVAAVEYKKGYVMRKCCYDSNNKKSKFD